MRISDFLEQELVIPRLRASRKPDVLRELAERLAGRFEDVDTKQLMRVLLEREELGSTALGDDIAIPHGKLDAIGRLAGCLARSPGGVDFGAEDRSATHFFFLLVAPRQSTGEHLKALARISRIFKNDEFRLRLMKAETAEEMYRMVVDEDQAASR